MTGTRTVGGARRRAEWHKGAMVPVLGIALAGTLLLMVFWRRHLGSLMQVASLLAAVLLLIWLQDNGYLGGENRRPALDGRFAPVDTAR